MSSAQYVYAVVDRNATLPSAAGLTLVTHRELAAVTRPVPVGGVSLTIPAVLQHEAIVEAVHELGPSLPVRFGSVFRDAAFVEYSLIEHYDSLVADLRRLGDKVEVSVTALWADLDSDHRSPLSGETRSRNGASYLRARAEEVRRDDAMRARAGAASVQLDAALGGRARARRAALLPSLGTALRTAYLLDPNDLSTFRAAFDTLRRAQTEFRLLLTGPWPPYTFVRTTEPRDGLARLLMDAMRCTPAEWPRWEGTTSN